LGQTFGWGKGDFGRVGKKAGKFLGVQGSFGVPKGQVLISPGFFGRKARIGSGYWKEGGRKEQEEFYMLKIFPRKKLIQFKKEFSWWKKEGFNHFYQVNALFDLPFLRKEKPEAPKG